MIRSFVVFLILLSFSSSGCAQEASDGPKNIIMFISDGCGPASITLAREYLRASDGQETLNLDPVLVGAVRTFATNSRITDSAASATAYACGIKTYNGAIAMDEDRQPVATLLEAAEAKGMATGLVATSRITHATPASYSAHVEQRGMEAEIAEQQIEQGIDVILGGGVNFFLPEEAGGRRKDGRNLLDEAADHGYHIVQSRSDFDAIDRTPVLGLFSGDHMDYEVDRDPSEQPSLAEMTTTALALLGDHPEGFFLMVEGSRIDHAAHANDAAGHLNDILAFDEAVKVALQFAENDGQTLFVSTSDHETGGLTLGRRTPSGGYYKFNPEAIARGGASYEEMGRQLDQGKDLMQVVSAGTGIEDFTEKEVELLNKYYETQNTNGIRQTLSDAVGDRAAIGWTTGYHSPVDVNLYAYGPGAEQFVGNHDNTAIGKVLADLMQVNLRALTRSLR